MPDTYIAVSRMIAGVICIRYVNGSASTTPITSVSPGSTATRRPSTMPISRKSRLTGSNTWTKPVARCCSISIASYRMPITCMSHRLTAENGAVPMGSEMYATFMKKKSMSSVPPRLTAIVTQARR